jgi:hypothetical protein
MGAGGATLALPFLEYTQPRAARAASAGPKRLLLVLHNMGTRLSDWAKPLGGQDALGEVDFELGEIMTPLAPHRERCVWLWGVDNKIPPVCKSNGHDASNRTLFTAQPFSTALTASGELIPREEQQASDAHAAGPSLDQVLGERLQTDHPFRSINLTPNRKGGATGYLFAGKDDPVYSYNNPAEALDVYFPPVTNDQEAARLERERKLSVLDAVHGNFNELRARVGREDKARLDAHADKLRDLERRIQNFRDCSRPDLGAAGSLDARVTTGMHQDLLVAGLSCDIAPVGSIIQGDELSEMSYVDADGVTRPYVPAGYDNWHDLVHRGGKVDDGNGGTFTEPGLIAGFKWHTQQFADLLTKMDAVDEGDGTLLDNTLVLWASMFGNGAGHNNRKLHLVLAGNIGAGGQLGRCLKYAAGDATKPNDFGHSNYHINHLYVSILRAFGFDDETFGFYTSDMTPGPLPYLV